MWNRRQFVSRGGLGLAALTGSALGFSGDGPEPVEALPDGSASRNMVTSASEAAVERGLHYLNTNRRGGSFGTRAYAGNVAVCSLSALAFLAAGHQPERGKHGRLITEALRFVLAQEGRSGRYRGYLHNPQATPHGPMYGHGFATLFLGEVYGMVHDRKLSEELKEKLRLALQLIVSSQNREGGWRYHPYSLDADLSVTVCQIMALRSARNAGFAVPSETVEKCIAYVKRCQDRRGGWFRYMAQGGGPRDAFARTGAGLAALYSAGVYSGPEIEAGLRYLATCKPAGGNAFLRPDMQYYYGHYYSAQAMWTAGGQWWQDWFPAIREELLSRQGPDGSWEDAIDPHYATAMACIILQIPNNYLPILQK